MSYEDIVPYQFRSGDEAEKNGRKGGVASGASRRRKRSLKDAADLFLSLPVNNPQISQGLEAAGLDPDDIDYQMAVIAGMTIEAVKGNPKAAKILMEMLGDNTKDDPVEDQMAKARDLLEGLDSAID